MTSTPASRSAAPRFKVSGAVPTAATDAQASHAVLQAFGNSVPLKILDRDHAFESWRRRPPALLDAVLVQEREHLSLGAFSRTVNQRSFGVITVEPSIELVSKRRSRCVTMPTTFVPSTTGTPEIFLGARELDDLANRHAGFT